MSNANDFDDVDQLLLVIEAPVDVVVVARAEIHHEVFVAVEEHDSDGVVQLVHLVEVRDLRGGGGSRRGRKRRDSQHAHRASPTSVMSTAGR
jgi:hypothetical protein